MRMPCPNNMTMTHDTSVLFGFNAFHIHGIHKAAPVVPTKLTARARKVAHSCPSRKPSSLWRQNEVDFTTKFCLGLSSKVHNLLCTLEACTYSLQLPVVATKLTAIVTLGDSKDLQTWQADTDDQDPIRINYTFEENIRNYCIVPASGYSTCQPINLGKHIHSKSFLNHFISLQYTSNCKEIDRTARFCAGALFYLILFPSSHLAMGPHRLAIVCNPFLSVRHSNQTGTSCLTMTGTSNENQKSWKS